jgi:hypothetical protein
MAEVLAPTRHDITQEFARGFEGMTENPVTLDEQLNAREDLIAELVGKMPNEHRRFLASIRADHIHVRNVGAQRLDVRAVAILNLPGRFSRQDGRIQVRFDP